MVRCKFCSTDILSKNFVRHMEFNHRKEKEVAEILELPKRSKSRRTAFSLLRNDTNFHLFVNGIVRPYRQTGQQEQTIFYPCVNCKGLFKKHYLRRHKKLCLMQKASTSNTNRNYIADSQTLTACAMDPTNVISRLNVKNEVRIYLFTLNYQF